MTGVCTGFTDWGASMLQLKFVEATVCTYAQTIGFLTLGMIVYVAIVGSMFIRTKSVSLIAVLILLTGGLVLTQMAPPVLQFVALILLTAFGVGATLLVKRYR